MKNNILLLITGMALGCIAVGLSVSDTVGVVKTMSTVMLIFGICWTIPFAIINRKTIARMFH